MSLTGFLDSPGTVSYSLPTKYMFSSAGLSLALTNGEGGGEAAQGAAELEGAMTKVEGYESRSGSDNVEGGSGDDVEQGGNGRGAKRKKYHRHTPQQIQELESLFKECPHPDEKQRMELSRRLNLESRQVKFWFQNRRTQMKMQLERHENALLRQENDRLKAENMCIRDAMRNPICPSCGGPAMLGEVSVEEQHLRIENTRLKDELERVCSLAGKFLVRPIPAAPVDPVAASNGLGAGFAAASSTDLSLERSVYLEKALGAMEEMVKMVQLGDPLWVRSLDGSGETLNYEEYGRLFQRRRSVGLASEATRETGTVIINSMALVETLMDASRWADMFSCMVARATTTGVISHGVDGTRNGSLHLMRAELQVLSPLVPIREVSFLRFCKQHAEGVWAVVDISVDGAPPATGNGDGYMSCRRLASGCVVQDLPNGSSKVTWVEHAEYDETAVHQLYRPLLRSGMGLGASRWVATLHRQCECLAILLSNAMPAGDHTAITPVGRRSMLKLARRMTDNFCAGVCPSTAHKWNKLSVGTVDADVRVMTRKSVDDPGEPPGVVLSAATSVWLPVPPQRLFDFLRNESLRSEWDILSNGGPMQQMAHIAKGQNPGNSVSLLRASAVGANQSSMLILQETCTDASGSLVVYAPVDIPAMHLVMNGGDSACVALLPSGFAILPSSSASTAMRDQPPRPSSAGSLLTVAFQILVNSLPTAKLTVESVETVNNLIACTVQKIKSSLNSNPRSS